MQDIQICNSAEKNLIWSQLYTNNNLFWNQQKHLLPNSWLYNISSAIRVKERVLYFNIYNLQNKTQYVTQSTLHSLSCMTDNKISATVLSLVNYWLHGTINWRFNIAGTGVRHYTCILQNLFPLKLFQHHCITPITGFERRNVCVIIPYSVNLISLHLTHFP
jgi:hypothetical protein